jgi:hypothetical protein
MIDFYHQYKVMAIVRIAQVRGLVKVKNAGLWTDEFVVYRINVTD